MRGLLICVSVALLAAAPALGVPALNATISFETAGSVYNPVSGMNEIACETLTSPTFYVDIMVTSDDASGMSAFGITLDGTCPLTYAAMENMMGQCLNYSGQYVGYASRGGMVDRNWSQADGTCVGAGDLPMAGPLAGEELGTINEAGTMAVNGLAVWLKFNTPGCPLASPGCVIGARSGGDVPPAYVGDHLFQPMNTTVIPLLITPEPVSALLLLLGLPFLRRRR